MPCQEEGGATPQSWEQQTEMGISLQYLQINSARCGEHINGPKFATSPERSTPRKRGKLGQGCMGLAEKPLNPARIGGENELTVPALLVLCHSAPRKRGKQKSIPLQRNGLPLNPAFSGKTSTAHCGSKIGPTQPHVCGENVINLTAIACASRSAPRTRGKLDHDFR